MEKIRKCYNCERDLEDCASHGEYKWYYYQGWRYWCDKCYDERFYRQVRSSPIALAKYYDIYGKAPNE